MTRMHMKLTPETNVDGDRIIIDIERVFDVVYDWNQGVEVLMTENRRRFPIIVREISLYDHILLFEEEPHLIISAVSKGDPEGGNELNV